MDKNKVLFILLLIISNFSCDSGNTCKKISIPKGDFDWVKSYKVSDKIIFSGDKGNFDTLELIEKKKEFSPCNRFELGPNQYESSHYTFLSQKMSKTESATAGIRGTTGNSIYGYNKRVIWAFGLYWVTKSIDQDKKIQTEKIKIPAFKDSIETLYFTNGNYSNGRSALIDFFNWNKVYGLVRFKLRETGETYEYYKRL
ncbi:MAG: hypothetical protein K0S23_1245 [Fluviicola sp.]|jgi:hypothetical protein|uniref:hypothetical protein n=1 Tax=Fluviicola sp. TaxID=1917219 RepID=UPI00261CE21A|nr:hypothetical protein [Fluviicola sp.]MDF3026938.1 hypothetical protein [Fluviicola sp.]